MRQRLHALKASMQDQGVKISEPDRGGIGCEFEQVPGENGPLFVVVRLLRGGSALASGVVAEGDALVKCDGQVIDNMLDLRDLVHGNTGDSITCVFRSESQESGVREYEVVLQLQSELVGHASVDGGSEHLHSSAHKKPYAPPPPMSIPLVSLHQHRLCSYTLSQSADDGQFDSLMQKLIQAESLVMESDALYAGVQQSLVSTLQGDALPFQGTVPVLYNTEDGRNWKHEYEMLSLVLARYVCTACRTALLHQSALFPSPTVFL
jgi:hypothetical protein